MDLRTKLIFNKNREEYIKNFAKISRESERKIKNNSKKHSLVEPSGLKNMNLL
jgi:hypothetical protein